ncbi:MAG: ImmA/IrrE family metallo-endopeptidase [Terracidiphilus sp.]
MSLLIERFTAATDGLMPGVAEDEIVKCVKALRRRSGLRAAVSSSLEPFLASRNIRDVAIDDELKADGALVPLGEDFGAGFRMVLRRDLPEGRINFTVAHEICHTFFYERVPEIKFASHTVDQEEERLCNCGAEEILMPAMDVRRCAKSEPVSLDALQVMATRYRVSIAAMLIRLQRLGLWHAELFLWHEMTNGTFAVKRAWGGKLADWEWMEPEIPRRVLSAPADSVISGSTYWLVRTPKCRTSKALSFQAKRHGNDVLVLVINKFKKASTLAMPQQCELFLRPATLRQAVCSQRTVLDAAC